MNPIRLWIDDIRTQPNGYIWIKNVNDVKNYCIQHLSSNLILNISEFNLDHDSGDYFSQGGDYIEILKWLEQKQYNDGWIINSVFKFHSMNPVGVENMRQIVHINHWEEI